MKFLIRAELTRGDTDSVDICPSCEPCVGRARTVQYKGRRDATRAQNRVKFKARPPPSHCRLASCDVADAILCVTLVLYSKSTFYVRRGGTLSIYRSPVTPQAQYTPTVGTRPSLASPRESPQT